MPRWRNSQIEGIERKNLVLAWLKEEIDTLTVRNKRELADSLLWDCDEAIAMRRRRATIRWESGACVNLAPTWPRMGPAWHRREPPWRSGCESGSSCSEESVEGTDYDLGSQATGMIPVRFRYADDGTSLDVALPATGCELLGRYGAPPSLMLEVHVDGGTAPLYPLGPPIASVAHAGTVALGDGGKARHGVGHRGAGRTRGRACAANARGGCAAHPVPRRGQAVMADHGEDCKQRRTGDYGGMRKRHAESNWTRWKQARRRTY